MKLLRVGAAILNQTPLDWEGNLHNILNAIQQAREQKVEVLCLPEMSITGYGCEDSFHAPFVQQTAIEMLGEIIPFTKGMIVSVGIPFSHHHGLFNTVALLVDGHIAGIVAKQHLAGDGIHYEPRWFKPWREGVRVDVELFGVSVPFGDLIFDIGDVRIGFEICEDAWVANRPGAKLAKLGVDVILNPSASHFAFGKRQVRERFVVEGSRAFGVSYVYSNLIGNESGRAIYDGGAMIASNGCLVAQGPRLSYSQSHVTSAVIDLDLTRTSQSKTSSFIPEPKETEGLVRVSYYWHEVLPEHTQIRMAAWEECADPKEEEFTRAVALGLFDYLRKSHSNGFVVSLSGGADSTAVSCLVRFAIEFAAMDLGVERVRELLNYVPGIEKCYTVDSLVGRLLVTIYQATSSSSTTTRNAAHTIAKAVHSRHMEFGIQNLVDNYRELAEDGLGRRMSWETDDLALQNIQARVRGPGAWMIANVEGMLLLATSNRSEAALGYATMDGDTCGGLAPITGIDKAFLRQWLKWLEKTGPDSFRAVPELCVVNTQASTPELRPDGSHQTSESDLMPFPILDRIEKHAVRDKRSPKETLLLLCSEVTDASPEKLREYVLRFYSLFARNQWKRERYAPSFHLDDENLDPKTWFRFPILSGGFKRELEELKKE